MNEPTNGPTGAHAPLGFARRPFAVVALISLLAVVATILAACGAQQGTGGSASPSEPSATEEQAEGDTAGDRGGTETSETATGHGELGPPVLGDEDAPVTMVEYADYQ